MKPKFKSFIFNFIGFTVLFIIIRSVMWFLISSDSIFLAIVAAVLASLLSPKFAVAKTQEGEKLFMKWVFIKGVKEV